MLTVGKPARRPETFRRLTGVDTDTFYKIAELIRPLWEERRDNFGEGGREHSLQGHENHLPAMLLYLSFLSKTILFFVFSALLSKFYPENYASY